MNRPKKSYHCNKCGYIGDASEHSGCDYLACTSLDSQYADYLEAEVSRLTAELADVRQEKIEAVIRWEHEKTKRGDAEEELEEIKVAATEVADYNLELLKELAELRSQEPVANIVSDWQIWFVGNGPIAPLVEKHGLKIGDHLFARPVPAAQVVPDRDALIDLINEHVGDAYFCNRVWNAWHVGTMSEDDFSPVSESDTSSELADAVISMLAAAPTYKGEKK